MGSSSAVNDDGSEPARDGFGSTEWSLVLEASTSGGRALDRLCRTYWRPVYVYIRASGVPRDEAEDATQEFFLDMLKRDWLKRADRERGSFRAFLRGGVRFFLNNQRRKSQAQKRGGDDVILSMETAECERELERLPSGGIDPALLFERSWADCVVSAAVSRLEAEQAHAGKSQQFARLRGFLTTPPSPGDYERIAGEADVSTGQVALWVHRLSRRFAEIIRLEVAETLSDRRELEAELRHLRELVAGRPG